MHSPQLEKGKLDEGLLAVLPLRLEALTGEDSVGGMPRAFRRGTQLGFRMSEEEFRYDKFEGAAQALRTQYGLNFLGCKRAGSTCEVYTALGDGSQGLDDRRAFLRLIREGLDPYLQKANCIFPRATPFRISDAHDASYSGVTAEEKGGLITVTVSQRSLARVLSAEQLRNLDFAAGHESRFLGNVRQMPSGDIVVTCDLGMTSQPQVSVSRLGDFIYTNIRPLLKAGGT